MIEVDVSNCIASLEKYKKDLESKFNTLVHRTVSYWASGIIEITPVGDSIAYKALYDKRPDNWAHIEGLLMGNWRIEIGDVSGFKFDPSTQTADPKGMFLAKSEVGRFERNFKLGDVITIYNATPYANEINFRGSSEIVPLKSDALTALMNTYKYAYSALT